MQHHIDQNVLADAGVEQLVSAFDLIPDILFWVKDIQGRFVHCNRAFLSHIGCANLDQVVHKTDYDFSRAHIAHQFVNDDNLVMKGRDVTDRLELNQLATGELGWFLTTKRILSSANGAILGTYGVTRHLQATSKTLSTIGSLDLPVSFIQKNYSSEITVEQLADLTHLSVSALERRFKKYMHKTPNQYINEVRLENAKRLLVETQLPVSEIAYQCGFTDASYFSRKFKRLFGELPSACRSEMLAKS